MGSPWSDIARRVSECFDKDHAECDQNICTPDSYPLHWMEQSELELLLKLTDHVKHLHREGERRPKTGPDQDTDDHTLDQPDATFPDDPAPNPSGQKAEKATGERGAVAKGPFDHLVDGKALNEEHKAAQEATNKALKNLRDAMGPISTEPDPDFKFDKGEKPTYVAEHEPLDTKGEITPSPRGRMRMTYVGRCSCGWESPHRFPSMGAANSSIHQHIRSPK